MDFNVICNELAKVHRRKDAGQLRGIQDEEKMEEEIYEHGVCTEDANVSKFVTVSLDGVASYPGRREPGATFHIAFSDTTNESNSWGTLRAQKSRKNDGKRCIRKRECKRRRELLNDPCTRSTRNRDVQTPSEQKVSKIMKLMNGKAKAEKKKGND